MKKLWQLIALGLGAYLVFLLVTLPASVVLARLEPMGVYAAGVTGTAWRGQAQVLQVGDVQLGNATWNLHVLPLFLARVETDVRLTQADGFAQSHVIARPGGTVEFRELTAALPVAALPPTMVRGQWSGMVNLKFRELALENGWPTRAEGTLAVLELSNPARQVQDMGSYNVTFSPPAGSTDVAAEVPTGTLIGTIADLGGPLEIAGTLQLRPDRSYLIDGLIAVRPDAPREIANAVQILGEPDAQGRRPFALEGTL